MVASYRKQAITGQNCETTFANAPTMVAHQHEDTMVGQNGAVVFANSPATVAHHRKQKTTRQKDAITFADSPLDANFEIKTVISNTDQPPEPSQPTIADDDVADALTYGYNATALKIGVIGQPGAGKSTWWAALYLFRIYKDIELRFNDASMNYLSKVSDTLLSVGSTQTTAMSVPSEISFSATIGGETWQIQAMDCTGQFSMPSITGRTGELELAKPYRSFLKACDVVLVFHDHKDPGVQTLDAIDSCLQSIGKKINICLVITKADEFADNIPNQTCTFDPIYEEMSRENPVLEEIRERTRQLGHKCCVLPITSLGSKALQTPSPWTRNVLLPKNIHYPLRFAATCKQQQNTLLFEKTQKVLSDFRLQVKKHNEAPMDIADMEHEGGLSQEFARIKQAAIEIGDQQLADKIELFVDHMDLKKKLNCIDDQFKSQSLWGHLKNRQLGDWLQTLSAMEKDLDQSSSDFCDFDCVALVDQVQELKRQVQWQHQLCELYKFCGVVGFGLCFLMFTIFAVCAINILSNTLGQ